MKHREVEARRSPRRTGTWSVQCLPALLIRRLTVPLVIALAVGCESGPSGPEREPTLSLTLGLTSVTVEQGASAEVTGTATGGGPLVGPPTVDVLGAPGGVSGTVGPPTTTGNTTTIPVTITVGLSVTPGTYSITVRASMARVSDEATLTLIVTAAAQYTLQVAPTPLEVGHGSSATADVTLTRTDFSDVVTLTAQNAPRGMTVAFDPAETSGDASEVTVTVDASVPEATYDVTIRGEAPGLEARTVVLQVEVTAAPDQAYSLSVTPNQLTLDPAQPAPVEASTSGPVRVSTGEATVEITRTNGHTEPVSLELIGQPEGVTGTFEPQSVSESTSALTLSVGATVAPGEYVTSVRGQDGVLPERTTQLLLVVTPTSTYQLLPDPGALTIEHGTSGATDIGVSRTNFTGDVTLSLEGAPAGIAGFFAPNPATGEAATLTLEVSGSVPPGDYDLTVRGTAAGLADRTAPLTVTVVEEEGFSLGPVSGVTVQQGASDTRVVTISRTGGFTGTVALAVAPAVTGLTMGLDPVSTTGDGTTLTVTAAASVAPGTYLFEVTGTALGEPDASVTVEVTVTAVSTTVTVRPTTIDDVLYNPGMGFVDSHFGYGYDFASGSFISFREWDNPPPYPEDYPPSTVAYFRWCWNMIEPVEGQIDFDRIDTIIENGAVRSEGERLGFRIITVDDRPDCMPDWLLSKPGYVGYDGLGRHVPDYSNPVFLGALEQLYGALGARYDGHAGMDHIDLGIVGCWGEWNTACLSTDQDLCQIMGQSTVDCQNTFERVIDILMDAFPNTPKIMLGKGEGVEGDAMDYALDRGAGWRVDCFGDWGHFGPDWNHHTDAYPQVVSRVGDAWQWGPVHMEVCFTMPHLYYEYDMSPELVQQTFDWALDNHISVFNGKSTPVPAPYESIVEDFLKKAGYRLVIDALTHPSTANAGQDFLIETSWANLGVAPPYLPHQVAFRLRDSGGGVVAQQASSADILGWLPGTHAEADAVAIPAGLAPGTYALDVAILTPDGAEPAIDLAIEGKRSDGWYELSAIPVE